MFLIYCALASYIVNGVQMYFKLRKNLWNGYHSGATHLRQAAPFISLVCFCLNGDWLKIDAPRVHTYHKAYVIDAWGSTVRGCITKGAALEVKRLCRTYNI